MIGYVWCWYLMTDCPVVLRVRPGKTRTFYFSQLLARPSVVLKGTGAGSGCWERCQEMIRLVSRVVGVQFPSSRRKIIMTSSFLGPTNSEA